VPPVTVFHLHSLKQVQEPPGILPALESGAVVLFEHSLCATNAEVERIGQFLSASERQRATRYLDTKYAQRFVVGRATLRRLLAACLDLEPAEITFEYGPHGKPELPTTHSMLRFNVSHSGDMLLCALAAGREVGVDIEEMRAGMPVDHLAQRFFSPAEVQALEALPSGDRVPAFYQIWTRKEAYLKARGDGLTVPLSAFSVHQPGPDGVVAVAGPELSTSPATWRVFDVPVRHGCAAALALAA
jgi:4'-phosphopantetheinyl transferase